VPGSANTYIPVVPAVFRIRIQSGQWIRIWIDIQLKCWMDPDSVNPDPRHWVKVPTHVVSAAPGSADTHISVGTGTYSPRQCAWIRRYLHTCKYRYLLTSSVQRLDPQIPTYLQVPVPTHLISAAPGSADTYIPLSTGTYSPHQCWAWIRRYLHICRYQYLLTSSVQRLDPQIPTYL
jgi:hypothetical protein